MVYKPMPRNPNEWTLRWFVGMLIASTFSLAYIVTPIYIMSAMLSFLVLPLKHAVLFSLPMLLEIIRLFDTHKEKVPLYKHKKLYID